MKGAVGHPRVHCHYAGGYLCELLVVHPLLQVVFVLELGAVELGFFNFTLIKLPADFEVSFLVSIPYKHQVIFNF